MAEKLSQPGCHTNIGARSGRSLVKLDEIPDNSRQRKNGRYSSSHVMRGQFREPKRKQKSGKKVVGRKFSILQFSSKGLNPRVQDKKEIVQRALTNFREMRNPLSSRSALEVLAEVKEKYPHLVLSHCEVGEVPWVEVGACFQSRAELCLVRLHRYTKAGIDWMDIHRDDGNLVSVALSIVVSGGYQDNLDEGETLRYTGEGGQNEKKEQIADQKMEGGNNALCGSCKRETQAFKAGPFIL